MENEAGNGENEVDNSPFEKPRKKVRLKKSGKVWYKQKRIRKRVEWVLWVILLGSFLTSLFLIWPQVMKNPKSPSARIKTK
jgi:hypothetical protein